MTEKLFYKDSYIADFEALVLSCIHRENRYEAVLDRTAFFPEGGGQSADLGIISTENETIQVLDVQEKDGIITHYVDKPLEEGRTVRGKIDFQERFSRMQQHTGEHIISGIVNSRFGYKNVGFHLGKDGVTMDYDGPLTWEDLREIEYQANQAVAENISIEVLYPTQAELEHIAYRSKIEIEGQVRIVQIPGYDSCACCAPHVKTTGSVGIIKITGAIHYKGGMRVSMLCGFWALADYNEKESGIVQVSNMLSAKQNQIPQAVERLNQEISLLKEKNKRMQEKYVMCCLKEEERKLGDNPAANLLLFVEELDPAAMRNFVNMGVEKTQGFCGVFAGSEEAGFSYVLGSKREDIRESGKKLNERFQGKGGGKPPMIQGSLTGAEEEIRKFLDQI